MMSDGINIIWILQLQEFPVVCGFWFYLANCETKALMKTNSIYILHVIIIFWSTLNKLGYYYWFSIIWIMHKFQVGQKDGAQRATESQT